MNAANHGPPDFSRRDLLTVTALGALAAGTTAAATAPGGQPEGQIIWAVHISLPPAWLDPAEAAGLVTPYLLLYALHDAIVKPMPGNSLEPCLAETVTMAPDGLSYDFVLRQGALFHNGEPVTAEDVKFTFERYRGTANPLLKERVAGVDALDARHVRVRLHRPWPDFLMYYANVTGAGWIVPKKYLEKVGDDGFRKAPIGAGPYKFVSFTPGVELILEAFEGFWRKMPSVKRFIFKVIPDEATRLAALRRGEVDFAYSIRGELAEEVNRLPGITLRPVVVQGVFCVYFADQFDPKSPYHDLRVRQAVSLAIDRDGINQALTLGHAAVTGNPIVARGFDFFWQPPPVAYDPDAARQKLAEAGFKNGFDGGEYFCDSSYSNIAEAVVNNLQEVGIRMKMRPLERAAFINGYVEKKFRNLLQFGPGAYGNAVTRLEMAAVKGGSFAYGSYPDLDELFQQQSAELDRPRRTAILDRMQELVQERVMFAPIWQLAFLNAQGPRIAEAALGLIDGHPYAAPYEDVRLKSGA
jgi:peptide/nickel transport system substrate-binding protein